MNNIIFTICSNNYLAQAKTLGDSVKKHNPDYEFKIFLCDKKNDKIDYSFLKSYEIIEANQIGIEKFDEMISNYNIVEFNTSIKPFAFEYLFKAYTNSKYIMYFDPDTYVFSNLKVIEEELGDSSILLTPHIYTPIEFDGKTPTENTFTQNGIYNLGFLALKRSENTNKLLNWWMKRLEINCYNRPEEGIFVDQLPMNFAPIFFENVKISKNLGINMAPWNLHERNLTIKDNTFYVNDNFPLTLYHFSNYNPNNPDLLSEYYTRVSFENNFNPTLKQVYDNYRKTILNNNYNNLSKIECFYFKSGYTQKRKNKSKIKIIAEYLKKYPLFLFRKDFWL